MGSGWNNRKSLAVFGAKPNKEGKSADQMSEGMGWWFGGGFRAPTVVGAQSSTFSPNKEYR